MGKRELTGCRVLVVEDEFFLAADLEDALDHSGADIVGPLSSVDTALAQLERAEIDLAVVDINLGGDMAYPLADALLRNNVPFLFASAYDRADVPSRFCEIPHVTKPYAMDDLIHTLAELARTRSANTH
jgi:two-component SAPR family response regulator